MPLRCHIDSVKIFLQSMCLKKLKGCTDMKYDKSSVKTLWALTALSSLKMFGKEIKNLNMLMELNIKKARRAPLYKSIEIMDNVSTLRMRKNNMLAVKEGIVRAFRRLCDDDKKLLYFKCIKNCRFDKLYELNNISDMNLEKNFDGAAKRFSSNLERENVLDIGVLSSEDWLKKQYVKTCREDRKYIQNEVV